ncbi:DUF2283 domain-containing protein [Archaeoglobus veneficus]|uniref:DUF2283 domain-containing protein n=1 Tax=Archaeoglobus veneficus (strain DSM 11195 / SNP6) TaxID=693661 RepID=F2KQ04_ARCVS|nr:DUF2283 domain-containing protein [Archaeoglobus veneficus]AEA46511.1 hypothetical protein Arcve_0479 [Archaeoglobus veneficus SNP6]
MKKILYDKDSDALIIVVSDKKLEYEEEVDDLIVGFSKDNEPVWIEILDFRKRFLPEVINKIADSGVPIKLLEV